MHTPALPPPHRRRLAGARLALVLLLPAACRPGGSATAGDALTAGERAAVAEAVERRLREATDLRARGDVVERLLSVYPDTGRVVSAAAGRVTVARDSLTAAVQAFWRDVGQNMRNPEWRWGPMQVDVLSRDAAVVTATYRIPHLTPAGQPHVIGGAWTALFVRRDGEWVIVQEHLSDDPGPVGPNP